MSNRKATFYCPSEVKVRPVFKSINELKKFSSETNDSIAKEAKELSKIRQKWKEEAGKIALQ